MKKFGVIGDPIEHSLSPLFHNHIFNQLGLNMSYESFLVNKNQLSSFVNSSNLDGYNVTIPHKEIIINHLDIDSFSDSASIIGAVNCVHQGKGYNTDWLGFLKAMKINNINLKDLDCAIIGAGGVAKAVAYALIKSNVKSISVINRTQSKADALIKWVDTHYSNRAANSYNVYVNCTPLGMWPKTSNVPFDINKILPHQIIIDTIYNPIETKWMKQVRENGANVVGGLDMFIYQALASLDLWLGKDISNHIELESIKKVLKLKLC